MNIIAVDDEQLALIDLQTAIKEALPESSLSCFDVPDHALKFAGENRVDVAFLDINMGGMNGLHLAKHLKEINGNTNIIFVTGYTQYALDAFSLHASGYILKPITADAVFEAMKHLNRPVKQAADKRLRIQTFGNFEVFVDEKPLCFARSKTKELFAYLVYRNGALCNNNEIVAVLWEDMPDADNLQSYYRHLVADLTKTLANNNIGSMLVKKRGHLAVDPGAFQCDLYDFYNGKADAVNRYAGEYMAQYSWAEFINGYLEDML